MQMKTLLVALTLGACCPAVAGEVIADGPSVLASKFATADSSLVPVEYLEGNKSFYFDTKYLVNDRTKLRFKFCSKANEVGYAGAFGDYKNEDSYTTRIIHNSKSENGFLVHHRSKAGGGGRSVTFSAPPFSTGDVIEGTLEHDKAVLNGMTITLSSTEGSENANTLYLMNSKANTDGNASMARIYYFQILEGGKLIHDYIPCRRQSDNAGVFYDRATGSVLEKIGSGTPVVGSDLYAHMAKVAQFGTYEHQRGILSATSSYGSRLSGSFSMSVWVKNPAAVDDDATYASDKAYMRGAFLMRQGAWSGDQGTAFYMSPFYAGTWDDAAFRKNPQWKLEFQLRKDADNLYTVTSTETIGELLESAPNEWHHLVAVVDASATTVTLYFDGKVVNTTELTTGSKDVAFTQISEKPFEIGGGGADGRGYKGYMAEASVWSRALNAEEVGRLATLTALNPAGENGLLGYWPLSDGTDCSTTVPKLMLTKDGAMKFVDASDFVATLTVEADGEVVGSPALGGYRISSDETLVCRAASRSSADALVASAVIGWEILETDILSSAGWKVVASGAGCEVPVTVSASCPRRLKWKTAKSLSPTCAYTPVGYIQSQGAQIINTGYYPNKNSVIELALSFHGNFHTYNTEAGRWNSSFFGNVYDNVRLCSANFGGSKEQAAEIFWWLNRPYADNDPTYRQKYGFDLSSRQTMKIDLVTGMTTYGGTELQADKSNTATCSTPLHLWGVDKEGVPFNVYDGGMRLYGAKISEQGTLLHEFIPVCSDATGTYGLFDLKTGVFVSNCVANAGSDFTSDWSVGGLVEVVGEPANIGDPTLSYGKVYGLEAGTTLLVSAADARLEKRLYRLMAIERWIHENGGWKKVEKISGNKALVTCTGVPTRYVLKWREPGMTISVQ